ncbi:tumor necrosis factor receptor superfamily member 14-like [Periophthalmus magnuspinnatus]|uniref:tumor necrosis factor receptor superfamily member 14-like n=1 Tax=Periophthalmus magnuspinnatus TaxID=409849 RepID=UPI002436B579|nr:tumor necrosis factor receptor superfamily member 14-like [Periophthalmus magnuspinnatus]
MKCHQGVTVFLTVILIEVTIGLTCHRAEYLIGQECCPMCPVGTWVNKHCTDFRSTLCLPCDTGTYMDEPTGRTECLPCRICASGSGLRVKAPCSSTANTVCEPEEGHFCVGPLDDGSCEASQRHKPCQPGYYIKQPGSASADTECSPCPQDTFSDGTVSACQPHTQCEEKDKVTEKEGTPQSDTECAERPQTPITEISVSVVIGIIVLVAAVAVPVVVIKIKKKTSYAI